MRLTPGNLAIRKIDKAVKVSYTIFGIWYSFLTYVPHLPLVVFPNFARLPVLYTGAMRKMFPQQTGVEESKCAGLPKLL